MMMLIRIYQFVVVKERIERAEVWILKKKKNRYHVEGTELNFIKREKRYMSVHIFKKGGG